jgi:GT2 family glycosyltransferase/ADP-heptose:LPS heptosyltransferase
MTPCYMIKTTEPIPGAGGNGVGQGGNKMGAPKIIVRRTAAIGDSVAASFVADKLMEQGYEVVWQTHSSIHCVFRHHPRIHNVTAGNSPPTVNLDDAYEKHPSRRVLTFAEIFTEKANEHLAHMGISIGSALNCRPELRVSANEKRVSREKFKDYPRPWVFVCPRSNSYVVRQVPDYVWAEAAPKINGTKFWMGTETAPAGYVDLGVRHLDNLIVWLSVADLLVSVDTGPIHLAAAMGIPIVAIGQSHSPELHLSDQSDFMTIWPAGLDCLNCQKNQCPIDQYIPPCQKIEPELISRAANYKLMYGSTENVSAIIAIYRPDVNTLNRCLACLLPQVQEIIVTHEGGNSVVPPGMIRNDKIRVVVKGRKAIGYGRNVNFGARHSSGKFLLLMNDDVFLEPDAVALMMREFKPDVGMVANRLMYPDGTVYHAGKRRSPGERGWGHINCRQRHWEIKEPVEMENVCGACVMVRRKAFYDIAGFDETFFLFAEDDDFALRLRRAGWKIMYTPHSWGVHLEHQSVQKIGDTMTLVRAANKNFDQKWRGYFDHNYHNSMGNFDY